LVTVERLFEGNLMDDPAYACATLPEIYVRAVAVVPRGAWPYGFADCYPEDTTHVKHYMSEATSEEGFLRYLEEYVVSEAVSH
jgi:glutaconate CoA-transferase subunit A